MSSELKPQPSSDDRAEPRTSAGDRAPISTDWLAAIIESAGDAIVTKTLDGVITSWNQGAERLFGYEAAEVIGRHVSILIPSDHADEEPGILRRIAAGERIEHYETIRVRKDGQLIDVSLTVSPIRGAEGKIIGASKIARDITEQKRTSARLVEALRQADELRRQAEEASRLKDVFVATVSHELRTPLTAIIGWMRLLRSGKLGKADTRRALETIDRNAKSQAQLIEDLRRRSTAHSIPPAWRRAFDTPPQAPLRDPRFAPAL